MKHFQNYFEVKSLKINEFVEKRKIPIYPCKLSVALAHHILAVLQVGSVHIGQVINIWGRT